MSFCQILVADAKSDLTERRLLSLFSILVGTAVSIERAASVPYSYIPGCISEQGRY